MRFLVFLSFILTFRPTVAKSSVKREDVNLFFDPDSDLPFSDDVTLWPGSFDDPTLNQLTLADANSDTLDWPDSVELAGVDDFCAADEEVQIIGRMRARDGKGCTSPDQIDVNLLSLPNLLGGFQINKQQTRPVPEVEVVQPLRQLAPPPDDNPCEPQYPNHLCCEEPATNSLNLVGGVKVYNVMRLCDPGTKIRPPMNFD